MFIMSQLTALDCRAPEWLACSRLRDSGEKSFSKKKCEKRAGAGVFALLVVIRPHYTI